MTGTVHVRRTIVVEYATDREDYDEWDKDAQTHRQATDDEIRRQETSLKPWDLWPDLSPQTVTGHLSEVTFR